MIDQRECKTLACMTNKELAYVNLAYGLEKRLGEVRTINNQTSTTSELFSEHMRIKRDLSRNRDRIQSLNPWLFLAAFQSVFDKLFIQQKALVSLMALTAASGYLMDLVFPFILLTFPSFAVLFAMVKILLLATWIVGYSCQEALDKQCPPLQPKIVNNDVLYDIHPVKPGKKIWQSLSYSECIYLIFKQNSIEIERKEINLFDKNHNRIKAWDIEGNIINQP